MPARAYRVNDVLRGKLESRRDARLPDRAADSGPDFRNRPAGFEQLRARGGMDRAVDAATAKQPFFAALTIASAAMRVMSP